MQIYRQKFQDCSTWNTKRQLSHKSLHFYGLKITEQDYLCNPAPYLQIDFLDVAAHHAAFLEIALVVLLGAPEGLGWLDPRGDGLAVSTGGVQLGDLRPGLGFLLVIMGKDHAAILRPAVRPLTIDLGGVVEQEERVEQRFIGEARWIKCNLDDFRVAGAV